MYAARTAYQQLDAPWWSARLDPPSIAAASGTTFHLRPGDNRIWTIGPDSRPAAVPESKGLAYLRTLIRNPGLPITALDLSNAIAGHPGEGIDEADRGEVIDRRALADYRRRLADIDTALDEAQSWSDDGRVAALTMEREALLEQVASATGLGGRRRGTGGSAERARVAVRKAIAAAITRIDDIDPSTAKLLRDTVRTGTACVYEPDPSRPVHWVLD
jgi:soluble cytochrome b562